MESIIDIQFRVMSFYYFTSNYMALEGNNAVSTNDGLTDDTWSRDTRPAIAFMCFLHDSSL